MRPARGPAGQLRGYLSRSPQRPLAMCPQVRLGPRDPHPLLSTLPPFGNLLRLEVSIGKGLKQPQKFHSGMDWRPLGDDGEGPGSPGA